MDRWEYETNSLRGLEPYLAEFGLGATKPPPLPAKPVAKALPKPAVKAVPVAKAAPKPVAKPVPKLVAKAASAPQPAVKPAVAAAPKPSSVATITVSVLGAQQVLVRYGAKLTQDGKYGPGTQKAWADVAKAKKLNPTFTRVSATEASVDPVTYSTLQAQMPAAKSTPAPAVKATAAPAAKATAAAAPASSVGLIKVTVLGTQQVLARYGAKITQDGKFGPATQKAWADAARLKKVNPAFDRASPTEAWVDPVTYSILQAQMPVAKSTPAPATKATAATVKPSTAAPIKATVTAGKTEPSRAGLIKASVGTVQDILNKLGAKLKRDGLFGPGTGSAWAKPANAKKLSPTFDRAGPADAWVDPQAYAAISGQAGVGTQAPTGAPPPSAAETPAAQAAAQAPIVSPDQQLADGLVKNATTTIPVLVLQQAAISTGKFPNVGETGTWDEPTAQSFIGVFGIPNAYATAWGLALPQLVSADQTQIRLLDAQAKSAAAAAQIYLQRKATQEAADVAAQQATAANASATPAAPAEPVVDNSRWMAAVASATTVLSVLQVQQALRQLYELQREGRVPASPALPMVEVTGSWNPGTDDDALLYSFGNRFFPGGQATPDEWANVLARILSGNTLRGWGFADLNDVAWAGTSTIKMPPAAVSDVQQLATDYLVRTRPAASSDQTATIPIPAAGGGTVALDPSLITGQVPQQQMQPQQQSIPEPVSLTPNIPTAQPSIFVQQPSPTNITLQPQSVPVAINVSNTGDSSNIPAAPELSPIIATPPSDGSNTALWIALAGIGVVTVVALNRNSSPAMKKKKASR